MYKNIKQIKIYLVFILIPLFFITGCVGGNEHGDVDNSNGEVIEDPHGEDIDDSRETVILYFGDDELMILGLDGEYGFLKPVEREIDPSDDYPREALEQLMKGPLPEDGDVVQTIPESAELIDFYIEDNIAYVEFDEKFFEKYTGGTLAGAVFLDSIIYTLTEFPTVEQVMVTVGEEPWSDGHFIWEEPMGR